MKKLVLFMAGLFFANLAFGDTPTACPQTMLNKTSCLSGEKMQCDREFDSKTQDFRYEWHAVNNSGQAFDTYSPLYKKIPGLTPAKCTDSNQKTARQVTSRITS